MIPEADVAAMLETLNKRVSVLFANIGYLTLELASADLSAPVHYTSNSSGEWPGGYRVLTLRVIF
jgi:hypothetical protein